MIQNDELDAAIKLIAQVINERAQLVRLNGYNPQMLADQMTTIYYQLTACIDPDELEQHK